MGQFAVIVYCGCAGRRPLPAIRWGENRTERHFLTVDERRIFREWDSEGSKAPCTHANGLAYASRGSDAYRLISWAQRLTTEAGAESIPLVARLMFPSGSFDGDVTIVPASDVDQLKLELDAARPPDATRWKRDETDELFELWLIAIDAAKSTGQPLIFSYGR